MIETSAGRADAASAETRDCRLQIQSQHQNSTEHPTVTPMTKQPDGRWLVGVELGHGCHQYLFWVDGRRVLDANAAGQARNARNEPVSLRAVS